MGPEIANRLPAAEYARSQLYALTHEVFVAFDYGDSSHGRLSFRQEMIAMPAGLLSLRNGSG